MKFKTYFGVEVDLEPETLSKVMLLGFNFWGDDGWWMFIDAGGLINDDKVGRKHYPTPEEAAIAGIKYYTSGNKP